MRYFCNLSPPPPPPGFSSSDRRPSGAGCGGGHITARLGTSGGVCNINHVSSSVSMSYAVTRRGGKRNNDTSKTAAELQ
ncbi:hypothetical protein NDU88_000748 [Pleurodeles waltl]|uniref:Uncharacterized protein n=1 Tax=Pleurodeles waltl TaxID=8319 RepID=A0AAV7KR26_PLEWA|nr:hypothetical protein NDU88_000748 [Pleurodeles waltl]